MLQILLSRDISQAVANWTRVVAILLAICGGIWGFFRYRRELKTRSWERAHGAYERFLDLAIANPEFRPRYWTQVAAGDAEKRNKYRWFMARFLWAAEQVLLVVPEKRREWEKVLKVMLREHVDFLAAPDRVDEVGCYYGPLRALIEETVREARDQGVV